MARADAIVVARAEGWEEIPQGARYEHGDPAVTVRLSLLQTLKGNGVPQEFVLPGYITGEDDFNDGQVPYQRVRPGGRPPACFAANYKVGQSYLILLDRTEQPGGWTIHREKAAPVNEPLRSPFSSDAWFLWVKERVAQGG